MTAAGENVPASPRAPRDKRPLALRLLILLPVYVLYVPQLFVAVSPGTGVGYFGGPVYGWECLVCWGPLAVGDFALWAASAYFACGWLKSAACLGMFGLVVSVFVWGLFATEPEGLTPLGWAFGAVGRHAAMALLVVAAFALLGPRRPRPAVLTRTGGVR
jgi:hypothetical protein